jgi:hypothetical protein
VIGRLRTSARRLGAWAPFILIAAMPCLPARAQEVRPDFANTYLGVRLGTSQYATSGSDLTQALVNAGYADSSASIDSHRTVGSVYAGVPFFGPLALELGYVDLGRYPVAITTRSTQYSGVAQTALDTMRPAGRGATLGFGATVDLGRWFAVNPHVALLMLQSKQDITTPAGTFSDNRHDAGVAAGLALLFRPTRHLYLGGGVDCWGGGAHCDVLAYTADLEFHFGAAP